MTDEKWVVYFVVLTNLYIDDEIDVSQLESAQILKMEPETIEDIGEKIKQMISDVAHLF